MKLKNLIKIETRFNRMTKKQLIQELLYLHEVYLSEGEE